MKGFIVVLAFSNDDKGKLSSIAKERLNQGIKEYKVHRDCKFLLTGGYGEHFNKTDYPHAFYAKQYLIEKGVKERDILEFAESSSTIEDALHSKPIIKKYKIKNIIIVTSDFHLQRARYIFEMIFKNYNLSFSISKTNMPKGELDALKEHEYDALEVLKGKEYKLRIR